MAATWSRQARHAAHRPPRLRRQYQRAGHYTFGPTLAADGVTVLQTALPELRRQPALRPSLRTPATPTLSITSRRWAPSSRTSSRSTAAFRSRRACATTGRTFSPTAARLLAAPLLRLGARRALKTVVRGGGGIYYDRFGSGPLLDLARYGNARAARLVLSLNPAAAALHGLRAHHQLPHAHRPAAGPGRTRAERQNSLPDSVRRLHRASVGREGHRRGQRLFRAALTASAPSTSTPQRPSPATPCGPIRLMAASARCSRPPFGKATAWTSPTAEAQQILHRLRALYLVALRVQHRRHRLVSAKPVRPNDEWSNAGFDRRNASACMPCSSRRASSTSPPASLPTPARPGPRSPGPTHTATTCSTPGPTASAATRKTTELCGPGPALGTRLRHHPQQR
jgi:hypothetical protein